MLRGGAPLYIVRKERFMATEQTLMKFGLTKDKDNSKLLQYLIVRQNTH